MVESRKGSTRPCRDPLRVDYIRSSPARCACNTLSVTVHRGQSELSTAFVSPNEFLDKYTYVCVCVCIEKLIRMFPRIGISNRFFPDLIRFREIVFKFNLIFEIEIV